MAAADSGCHWFQGKDRHHHLSILGQMSCHMRQDVMGPEGHARGKGSFTVASSAAGPPSASMARSCSVRPAAFALDPCSPHKPFVVGAGCRV